jgi:pseudaminic acid cytidylyltransferase
MRLAVIPARGGSKRIPRKNIKEFHGRPMIAYAIEKSLESGLFDECIVSTDDKEIAEVAQSYGASIPFIRPKELSDDFASTLEVISHAVNELKITNNDCSSVCCLYATSPLLEIEDLKEAIQKFEKGNVNFVFSATEFNYPIQRAFRLTLENRCQMFSPEHFDRRSQDLERAYHDAGMFYIGTPSSFTTKNILFDVCSMPYIIPSWRVVDIDTQSDWERAELIYKFVNLHNESTV